jgi:hypothetical protein
MIINQSNDPADNVVEERAKICFVDADNTLTKTTESARALLTMLDRGPGAREIALCLTKLEEARHRLQDAAQILGYND